MQGLEAFGLAASAEDHECRVADVHSNSGS